MPPGGRACAYTNAMPAWAYLRTHTPNKTYSRLTFLLGMDGWCEQMGVPQQPNHGASLLRWGTNSMLSVTAYAGGRLVVFGIDLITEIVCYHTTLVT